MVSTCASVLACFVVRGTLRAIFGEDFVGGLRWDNGLAVCLDDGREFDDEPGFLVVCAEPLAVAFVRFVGTDGGVSFLVDGVGDALTGGLGGSFVFTTGRLIVMPFLLAVGDGVGSGLALAFLRVFDPHSGQNARIRLDETKECPLGQVKRNSSGIYKASVSMASAIRPRAKDTLSCSNESHSPEKIGSSSAVS